MKHIVIVTGGYLNIEFAENYLKTLSYDKVFAVDKGLEYVHSLGIKPDFIVGDFDSVDRKLLERYDSFAIEKHSPIKDESDTELAVKKAMEEKADKITILAAIGSRLDHVLMNLGLLIKTNQTGIEAYIIDETNRIRLLSSEGKKCCFIKRTGQYGKYISLVPLTEKVLGLTMKGVKYPLDNFLLRQGNSLTVSNEIEEEVAEISLENGRILVIESRD